METREFSERLRELREKAGLNQGELADKVGVNFTYLSKIESGVKPPPSEQVILRLAEVLDADRDELMTLAGKIPSDIAKILKNRDALQLLRSGHTQKKSRPANKKESFNIRLRELRKQADLSQRELADKIGVNFTYLSKIESGALPPPSEQVILRLAKVLNADKDELLTLAGKIPSDVVQMLKNREALQLLRSGHTQKKIKAATKKEGISMMKNLVNYKMLFRMAIPILLVCAVAASLWFTSPVPVRALTIAITGPSSGTLGDTYTFTVIVTIEEATDILPVHHIDLEIYNVEFPTTRIATCSSLPIPGTGLATDSKSYLSAETGGGDVTASVASAYGWTWTSANRYGYGYRDPLGMGYHQFGTSFGYGYGYNGNRGATSVTYTITWTSPSSWPEGAYRIKTLVYGDASKKFSGTSDSFTLAAARRARGGVAITRPAEPGVSDVSDVVTDEGVFTEDVATESEDGKVELDIDEGTVGETAEGEPLSEITVTEMEDPPAPPEDAEVVDEEGNAVASYEDVTVIGLTYDLGPDGATFDPPITLTFTYDPDEVPEGDTLVIAIWDETVGETGGWVTLESTVDPVTHTVTALVSHFTAFTILGHVPPEVPVAVEEIAELEASISELEAQVTALQADYDTATSGVAAAEALVASAQADYDTATSDVAAAQAQITSAQADYDTATSDIAAAQAQVSDLAEAQQRLAEAEERVDELEAERGIAWWVWLIVGLAVVAVGVTSWLVVRRRTA